MADEFSKARETLAALVAFDTTSRSSNLALIDYADAQLSALGARTTRVMSAGGDKANLFAAIGPDVAGGVALSGHTDVVPVDGQDWATDPWTLTEKDGRLYGRGSCDMKGFLACALSAASRFAAADLERPVYFALSYDEEVGCLGAPAMIEAMAVQLPPINAVIIGEPTDMKVVSAHKGLHSFRVDLHGVEAHSSLVREGACAVTHAVPLLSFLTAEARAMQDAAPTDSPFDPPFGTLTIGRFEGGTAANILAKHAGFDCLVRPAPWDDTRALDARLRVKAAEVEAEMRRFAPGARVVVETRSDAPALKPEPNGAAEQLARRLTGDNQSRVVSYGTEGGQFQAVGFSTVVCGPGSITQAHQPNEFVEIDQLEQAVRFMDGLISHLSR